MPKAIQHIAIIMDGNRRWARAQGLKILQGYEEGIQKARDIVEHCFSQSIPYLTLFAFSTENWKRPKKEVDLIEKLLTQKVLEHKDFIKSHNVRLKVIGDLSPFSEDLKQAYHSACEETKDNDGLNLIVAINYGGKGEILLAVKDMLKDNSNNLESFIKNMKSEDIEKYLQSSQFPSPDLLIRTGGVSRLSNFYLWSSAYSELYFSSVNWPNFTLQEFKKAIDHYYSSDRNFGGNESL